MREDKKRQRAQNKLAELLGLEVPKLTGPKPQDAIATASREAQATLEFVHNPQKFQKKICSHCERSFYVNRGQVGCCSDICSAKELAKIGIDWNWDKPPESRWGVRFSGDSMTREPLIVPPEALETLRYLVAYLGDDL